MNSLANGKLNAAEESKLFDLAEQYKKLDNAQEIAEVKKKEIKQSLVEANVRYGTLEIKEGKNGNTTTVSLILKKLHKLLSTKYIQVEFKKDSYLEQIDKLFTDDDSTNPMNSAIPNKEQRRRAYALIKKIEDECKNFKEVEKFQIK